MTKAPSWVLFYFQDQFTIDKYKSFYILNNCYCLGYIIY